MTMALSSKFFFTFFILFELSLSIEPADSGTRCKNQNISFAETEVERYVHSYQPYLKGDPCPPRRWTIQPGGPNSAIRFKFMDQGNIPNTNIEVNMFLIEGGQKKMVDQFSRYGPHPRSSMYWGFYDQKHVVYEFESRPNQGIQFTSNTESDAELIFSFTRINVTNGSCICPKFYYAATSEWQEISAPNYPNKHCPDMKCYYYLEPEMPNQGVEVDFDVVKFNESSSNNIYFWTRPYTSLLSWQKEKKRANETYRTHTHNSQLVMVFDGLSESEGWHAKFRTFKNPCACHEKLITNGTSGKIVSPGHPGYSCYTKCKYDLEGPAGKQIHLNFIPGERFSSQDFIIFNWRNPDNDFSLARWMAFTNLSFLSHGSKVFIEIEQNIMNFSMEYKVLTPTEGCQCQGLPQILTNMSGTVRIPMNSTSGSYCGPLDCFYLLKRPLEQGYLRITYHGNTVEGDYFSATDQGNVGFIWSPEHFSNWRPQPITNVTMKSWAERRIVWGSNIMVQFHSNERDWEPSEPLTFQFNFEWKKFLEG